MRHVNEIAARIVAYLREQGGVAEIGQYSATYAELFACSSQSIGNNLRRLQKASIIKNTDDSRKGTRRPFRYELLSPFREGDNWQEKLPAPHWSRVSRRRGELSAEIVKVPTVSVDDLNPLTAELVKVHEWASRVRAEIAPLKKRNEELEQKLQSSEAERKQLSGELAEANKDTARHRENEHAVEQRLMALRRENAAAMGAGFKEKILVMDNQGVQIEKKIL